MLDKNKTYALALGGGGFCGSYEAGAIKFLHEEDYKINIVVGTSIGSINAAMMCMGDFENLEDLWKNFDMSNILNVNEETYNNLMRFDLKKMNFKETIDFIKTTIISGGIDITPLKNMLNTYIDEDKVRNSNIDYGLVTVSLTDMKGLEIMIDEIPEGDLKDFILASAYVPGFKQEKINNKNYLDGGFYNHVPTSMLTNKGYKEVIEIDLKTLGIIIKPDKEAIIHKISPIDDLGKALSYDKNQIIFNYNLGYYDMLRYAKGYFGRYYTIKGNLTNEFFVKRFLNLSKNTIDVWNKGNKNISKERNIFENFIPFIGKKLNLEYDFDYKDVFFAIIEACAKILNVERFKVYNYNEFIEEIKNNYINLNIEVNKGKIIKRNIKFIKSRKKDSEHIKTISITENDMMIINTTIDLVNEN